MDAEGNSNGIAYICYTSIAEAEHAMEEISESKYFEVFLKLEYWTNPDSSEDEEVIDVSSPILKKS